MPYMDPFNKIIQTTKKNHRYYGPTESAKMSSFLSEVKADFDTIFDAVNTLRSSVDALASGYFHPSDDQEKLDTIRRSILEISKDLNALIYVEGQQPAVL